MRKRIIKKKIILRLIPIAIAVISYYFLFCFPIENLFIDFSTPDKAFHYLYSGNIKQIIDGNASTMVLYMDNDAYLYAIIPKKNNSWKLDVFQFNSNILSKTINKRIINVYNAKNTNDYYITIWDPVAKDVVEVTDSKGTIFQHIEDKNKATSDRNITYYGYMKGLEKGYTIIINGENVVLN